MLGSSLAKRPADQKLDRERKDVGKGGNKLDFHELTLKLNSLFLRKIVRRKASLQSSVPMSTLPDPTCTDAHPTFKVQRGERCADKELVDDRFKRSSVA
jgi:hypothetical protein